MYELKIYGASDDLIEIEGAMREEFNYHDDIDAEEPGCYLAASDGTLLHVVYGKNGGAFWRITVRAKGSAEFEKHEATDEADDYSDIITLRSPNPFRWILQGESLLMQPVKRSCQEQTAVG